VCDLDSSIAPFSVCSESIKFMNTMTQYEGNPTFILIVLAAQGYTSQNDLIKTKELSFDSSLG
jgi:hypothetical protein